MDFFQNRILNEWFQKRFNEPSTIQKLAWPEIHKGKHVLISSATGNGKTFAAFMCALDNLLNGSWEQDSVKILYISPLKALNNDIEKNLLNPLQELKTLFESKGEEFPEIRIHTRSGDTSSYERRKILKKPPDILITTPESLNIMLLSEKYREIFTSVKQVILDEIHQLAEGKRGTYLMTAVERLSMLSGEFQRIALSATVKPLEEAAAFVGGFGPDLLPRKVEIVQDSLRLPPDLSIWYPPILPADAPDDMLWVPIVDFLLTQINAHSSTLIFTNNRRHTEKISRFLNEAQPGISSSHHGSLSRELRLEVEQRLKAGRLKAVVATASLELGIDVGVVDLVIQLQAPFSLHSGQQRIGRANHQLGGRSKGIIIPLYPVDFFYSAVSLEAIGSNDFEDIHIPMAPLDVLAQCILHMLAVEPSGKEELFQAVKRCYSFKNLEFEHFSQLIELLKGRFSDSRIRELRSRIYEEDGILYLREKQILGLYANSGTIPDRGYYSMRLAHNGALVGELDEEFVFERSIGDSFTLGSQTWQITSIDDVNVKVSPLSTARSMFPFWRAGGMGRSFFFSKKVRDLFDALHKRSDQLGYLSRYLGTEQSAEQFLDVFNRFRKELPQAHEIILQKSPGALDDTWAYNFITFFGKKVNEPLSLGVKHRWRELFKDNVQVYSDDVCFLVHSTSDLRLSELQNILKDLENDIYAGISSCGTFAAFFRENAQRSMLIPKSGFGKRTPLWLNRRKASVLLEELGQEADFPLIRETWRELLQDVFDMKKVEDILTSFKYGELKLTAYEVTALSALASGVSFRLTSDLLYAPDSMPEAVHQDPVKDLIENKPGDIYFSEEILEQLRGKLMLNLDDYRVDSREDALAALDERLELSPSEYEQMFPAELISQLSDYMSPDLALRTKDQYNERDFLNWLFYRPFSEKIPDSFDVDLQALRAAGKIILHERGYIHPQTLEILLRTSRKERRLTRALIQRNDFQYFLLYFQGVQDQSSGELKKAQFDELEDVMEMLLWFYAPFDQWEQWILPARIAGFNQGLMDTLLSDTYFIPLGIENGQVYFALEDEVWPIQEAELSAGEPAFDGVRDFWSIKGDESIETAEANIQNWFYNQQITPLDIKILRSAALEQKRAHKTTARSSVPDSSLNAGIRSRRLRRPGHIQNSLWKRVRMLPLEDQFEREQKRLSWCRQLLNRYGILFRDMLIQEQWSYILPGLRRLELSGEIRAGHFVEGILGIQYGSEEALQLISDRDFSQGTEIEYCIISALDPASLAGVKNPELRPGYPARRRGTLLCFHRGKLAMYAESQSSHLTFPEGMTEDDMVTYLKVFIPLLNFPKIDKINGALPQRAMVEGLKSLGYRKDLKGFRYMG
jgi:ATP-dependent Lhr-like helicase